MEGSASWWGREEREIELHSVLFFDAGTTIVNKLVSWMSEEILRDPTFLRDDPDLRPFVLEEICDHYLHLTMCRAFEDVEIERVSPQMFRKAMEMLHSTESQLRSLVEGRMDVDRFVCIERLLMIVNQLRTLTEEYRQDAFVVATVNFSGKVMAPSHRTCDFW